MVLRRAQEHLRGHALAAWHLLRDCAAGRRGEEFWEDGRFSQVSPRLTAACLAACPGTLLWTRGAVITGAPLT
ncbi:hypothetical protein MHYP_G00056910 [Metynnis hypsauchen]